MEIARLHNELREKVVTFFSEQWGSPEMVISSGVYDCSALDGFAALDDKENIAGLITFHRKDQEIEIISLDSLLEGQGIGSMLVVQVERLALAEQRKAVSLITTNDNLNALKFYQKRGYQLMRVFPNAVAEARKIKPSIPLIGEHGIPLRDEVLLIKKL